MNELLEAIFGQPGARSSTASGAPFLVWQRDGLYLDAEIYGDRAECMLDVNGRISHFVVSMEGQE